MRIISSNGRIDIPYEKFAFSVEGKQIIALGQDFRSTKSIALYAYEEYAEYAFERFQKCMSSPTKNDYKEYSMAMNSYRFLSNNEIKDLYLNDGRPQVKDPYGFLYMDDVQQ